MNISWPRERFYWSLQDATVPAGKVPAGLLAALEDDLPQALDEIHAVCAPAGEGRAVICAALRSELTAIDPATLLLVPSGLPPFSQGDASSLNLLVGEFEPPLLRRRRAARRRAALAAMFVCSALLVLGMARRARAWERQGQVATDAARAALADAGVGSREVLMQELLRARRGSAGAVRPPPDAAVALASFLRSWPTLPARVSALAIAERTATVALSVQGDPAPFLKAFKSPAGWTLDEP